MITYQKGHILFWLNFVPKRGLSNKSTLYFETFQIEKIPKREQFTFQKGNILFWSNFKKSKFCFDHIPIWAQSKKAHYKKDLNIPKRAHSVLNTFQKEQIPKRANSILNTFQKEHIPFWTHSKKGTFQKEHIPIWSHYNSILITFQKGHIPKWVITFWSHSKRGTFQNQ